MNIPIIGSQFPTAVFSLIDGATKSIKVVVFDWRWYPSDPGASVQIFNQSFVRAVRRGVSLRVICNNGEIFKYLTELGAECRKTLSSNLVHAKLLIIDDKFLVIGSHNYTQHAFTMNREISLLTDAPETFPIFDKFFETLWLL